MFYLSLALLLSLLFLLSSELYEKFGTFSAVKNFVELRNNGLSPKLETIIKRIEREFQRSYRELSFTNWRDKYLNHELARIQRIGHLLHLIIEYVISTVIYRLGGTSFIEVDANTLVSHHRIDTCIIRDAKFRDLFENKQNIIQFNKNIYLINIDYTLTRKKTLILNKCLKNYQGKHKHLIIVILFGDPQNYQLNSIPYIENISIISLGQFIKVLSLDKVSLKGVFDEVPKNPALQSVGDLLTFYANMGKNAVFNEDSFESLSSTYEIYKSLKKRLEEIASEREDILDLSQEGFEFFIQNKSPYPFREILGEPQSIIPKTSTIDEFVE